MNPVTEYINTRIVDKSYEVCGEITTVSKITLDTGEIIEGKSVREINVYDAEGAESDAYESAVSTLIPGISLVLSKQ